jgi:rod shape-determining protein MreD
MMRRPQHLLLPVSPLFIAFSLIVAFLLNLIPWGQWLWIPDFVALTIVFWNLHEPRRVGISAAFFMGMMMDVATSTLLGENALAYTLLSYVSIMIHRRVLWFPVRTQALYILMLIFFMQVVQLVIRLLVSGQAPNYWHYFGASLVSAILWPIVTWLLLMPQKRVVNRDDNRPL